MQRKKVTKDISLVYKAGDKVNKLIIGFAFNNQ